MHTYTTNTRTLSHHTHTHTHISYSLLNKRVKKDRTLASHNSPWRESCELGGLTDSCIDCNSRPACIIYDQTSKEADYGEQRCSESRTLTLIALNLNCKAQKWQNSRERNDSFNPNSEIIACRKTPTTEAILQN